MTTSCKNLFLLAFLHILGLYVTGHRSVAVREYKRTGQAMKRKALETIQLCETKDNSCVKKPCTNVMVASATKFGYYIL